MHPVPCRLTLRLVVDDVLDEGRTLKAEREDCYRRSAIRELIATLWTRSYDGLVGGTSSAFNGVALPDRYVFG